MVTGTATQRRLGRVSAAHEQRLLTATIARIFHARCEQADSLLAW